MSEIPTSASPSVEPPAPPAAPVEPPAPPAAPVEPPAPPAAPVAPPAASAPSPFDDLIRRLAASPELAQLLATQSVTDKPPRRRSMPAVNELVSHTFISNRSSLPVTQRGIVLAADPDARTAQVVWLPDGEAMMPVDLLDGD